MRTVACDVPQMSHYDTSSDGEYTILLRVYAEEASKRRVGPFFLMRLDIS